MADTPGDQPTGRSRQDYRPFAKGDFSEYEWEWKGRDPWKVIVHLAAEFDLDPHDAIHFLLANDYVKLVKGKPLAGGTLAHTKY
jgi:hypothetical protein